MHESVFSGLTLFHFDNGNRFCFSTSLDKVCIYWDLSNNTKVSCCRKFGIADGQGLTNWPACLVAEDESTFNDKCKPNQNIHCFSELNEFLSGLATTVIKPIRGIMSGEYWTKYTFSQSGIKSVSFSDWLNLILHGGNAGDIMGQFAHRLFFCIDTKHFKKSYTKCVSNISYKTLILRSVRLNCYHRVWFQIFSTSKLVKKVHSSSVSSDVATYDQAAAHYGLAFLDYNSVSLL